MKLVNVDILSHHIKRLAFSIANLSELEILNLNSNDLKDEGLKALTDLRHLRYLKELHLDKNTITSKGMISLCAFLIRFKNLQTLSLNFNSIDDEGLKELHNINPSFVT